MKYKIFLLILNSVLLNCADNSNSYFRITNKTDITINCIKDKTFVDEIPSNITTRFSPFPRTLHFFSDEKPFILYIDYHKLLYVTEIIITLCKDSKDIIEFSIYIGDILVQKLTKKLEEKIEEAKPKVFSDEFMEKFKSLKKL